MYSRGIWINYRYGSFSVNVLTGFSAKKVSRSVGLTVMVTGFSAEKVSRSHRHGYRVFSEKVSRSVVADTGFFQKRSVVADTDFF